MLRLGVLCLGTWIIACRVLEQKRNKKQLEQRELAKKHRYNDKVRRNQEIEEHRVRELELDRVDFSGQQLKQIPPTMYTGLDAQRNLGRLVILVRGQVCRRASLFPADAACRTCRIIACGQSTGRE